MLKNISDYLSLFSLLFFTGMAFRIFLFSISDIVKDDNTLSRRELLRDYINNEEE